jgi:predicted MFS family arabinose efflux permease
MQPSAPLGATLLRVALGTMWISHALLKVLVFTLPGAAAFFDSVGIPGVLVDLFGWRAVFFMVVPLCVISLWLAFRIVPTSAPGGVAAQRDRALDWRGLLLATVGTLSLLNGLVELHGGSALESAAWLATALGCLAGFLAWERRVAAQGREPLLNLALFRYRTYAMGSIVAFIYGIALFGSTYLLPVYMQLGLQLSPSHVGTILLPAGIVLAITIGLVGRITHRVPTYVLVTAGLAMLAASFALMLTIGLATPLVVLVAWATLGRIGLGFVLPSLNLGAMRPLDRQLIPQGASAINFLRMLGGAAGVSLCAIVLEWRLAAHGDSLANTATSAARLAAFDESFALLALVCGVAILAAWQLRDAPREPAPRE